MDLNSNEKAEEFDGKKSDENSGEGSSSGAAGSPQELLTLQAELAAANAKLSETNDRMLRIAADFDNARKRWDKERIEARIYAIQEFAKDLLPVIDAFDKALASIENVQINGETEDGKKVLAIIEGVQLVSRVFAESTKKHGVEKLPGKGAPFNPAHHNAIAKVVDHAYAQETVIDEFVPGYKIGDRILRTAMVRVGAPD